MQTARPESVSGEEDSFADSVPSTPELVSSESIESGSAQLGADSSTARDESTESPTDIQIGTPRNDAPDKDISTPTPGPSPTPQPRIESDFDSDGDGFYTFQEFERAVEAIYPTYSWPDGYHIDPESLLSGVAEAGQEGAFFEAPGEYTVIGMRHRCAWQLTWLDAFRDGDSALMDASLDQLRTVALESPMIDAGMRDHLEEMFRRAELGDPAMMQQWVDMDCSSLTFITPESGSRND